MCDFGVKYYFSFGCDCDDQRTISTKLANCSQRRTAR